ncbi:MAG: RNA 2',3'-cyclic phosphodiesterase [Gammaproteobacteria bacterium]|nr:RNA 2',3'-cyclic phosphodiesterase [Gammaproteobacteria bacterium]
MTPVKRRLFLALWPDDILRRRLHRLAEQESRSGGRQVILENFHMTLAFLGGLDETQQVSVEEKLNTIQGQSFDLTLDQLADWAGPRVRWLGCSRIPDELTELVRQIRRGLPACGVEVEKRPFQPHVTLLRKVNFDYNVRTIEPLSWHVNSFVLAESVSMPEGVRYPILKRWPLVGHP